MQELITEIAIYLGLAAFLGVVLGYLIWGLGQRRRIEAARAEGAAVARTTIDGNSPLRSQIDSLTRERDRLEHRVELLSARVATLLEQQERSADGPDAAEHLGTVRMSMADEPGDPMDRAAEAFPRPADAEPTDQSIFATAAQSDSAPDAPEPRQAPAADAAADPVAAEEPGRPRHGDDSPDDDTASAAPRGLFIRRGAGGERGEDGESTADDRGTDSDASEAAEAAAPQGEGSSPDAGAATRGLVAAAASLRESLGQGDDRAPVETATGDEARAGDRPALPLSSPPDAPDDLTRIKGIGKSTEKALNANGIWLFRQLADLTDEDAEWIRAAIGGLPGRIARDRWSEQARALLDETGDAT